MADSCLTGFAEEIDDLAKEYESMKVRINWLFNYFFPSAVGLDQPA